MAVDLCQSRRFAAPSPVTRYWLANCVGFSLAGGARGTVERVLADADPSDPSLLEVRTGPWRVRRMPSAAVVEVIPADRLLVVDRRLALFPDRRRDVTVRLLWTARILRRGLGAAMAFLGALRAGAWRLSRSAWAVASPAVGRTSRRGGSEAVRLGSVAMTFLGDFMGAAWRLGSRALVALRAEAWRLSRRAWAVGSPAVGRTSRRGGSEAVRLGGEATRLGGEATRLVRSVPWQSYGRSARSATTRLSRARSTRSSRRRTTSSGRRKATSSSDEARRTSST
jgi:hypothetical protein